MKTSLSRNPIAKMESHLTSGYDFKYDEVLNITEFKLTAQQDFVSLTDYHLNSLYREIRLRGIRITKLDLISTLNSNYVPKYNPFADYFTSLPTWNQDSPDYISELSQTITVAGDTGEFEKYLRKWLVAVVACALKSNAVNETALILIGKQGVGKTRWLQKLLPQQLSKYYYSGNVNPNNKDTRINLAECFLINMDELESLRKNECETMKEMFSMPSNRIRRPYSAFHENIVRRASFTGSVNSTEFLKDNSGNRRYLCFEASKIQHAHKVDINGVYSQALSLLKNGFDYWLSEEDIQEINLRNQKYREIPFEVELFSRFFDHNPNGSKLELMTFTEIVHFLHDQGEDVSKISQKSFASALKKSDFVRIKTGGYNFYKVYRRTNTQKDVSTELPEADNTKRI